MCSVAVNRLTVDLQRRFVERSTALLHNLYGPTEATIDVTCWSSRFMEVEGTVPIGRPIANSEIYLLDSNLQPVPVGVTGELYIGGDGLARGYLGGADLTAEKFIPNPFSNEPGARLYKNRRSGALPVGWKYRISRSARSPGKNPRVSYRAGRN